MVCSSTHLSIHAFVLLIFLPIYPWILFLIHALILQHSVVIWQTDQMNEQWEQWCFQRLKSKSERHSEDFGLAEQGWGSLGFSVGEERWRNAKIFQRWIWDTSTTTPSNHCIPTSPSLLLRDPPEYTHMHTDIQTPHICTDACMHGLTHKRRRTNAGSWRAGWALSIFKPLDSTDPAN